MTGHTGDAIEGMDVSALLPENSPPDLLGWWADAYLGALAELSEPIITVPLVDLVRLVYYAYPYAAVGKNIKEHVGKVYVDAPPLLSPKLVRSSNWQSAVPLHQGSITKLNFVPFLWRISGPAT